MLVTAGNPDWDGYITRIFIWFSYTRAIFQPLKPFTKPIKSTVKSLNQPNQLVHQSSQKRHIIKHFWVKMKLLEAFIVSLFCTISFAFHVLNDNMLTSEPLLQYVPVGLLHANLSEMGAQRKVVLIQHLKNRNAAKLRQVIKLLLAKPNQKAATYQQKSEQKSQNKNRSRFNRFRKYHGN